jgi:DNA-cytosine methyltransferase
LTTYFHSFEDGLVSDTTWSGPTMFGKPRVIHTKIICRIPGLSAEISAIFTPSRVPTLVGCYPCQGYTQGGTRDWKGDDRNYLYREFDRVLRRVMPTGFIVENVNGMVFGENRDLLKNQLTRYRSAGYRVKWSVLNAKDYGVAQNRRRVFLVGVHSDQTFEYQFPKPTHGPGTRKKYVSQRDVMDRFPRWPKANSTPSRSTGTTCHKSAATLGDNLVLG